MASKIQIQRRFGGAEGAPNAGSMATGELAFNDNGLAAADPFGALVIGDASGDPLEILGARTQMELQGDQTATGDKTFQNGDIVVSGVGSSLRSTVAFSTGVGGNDVVFPITRGTANQVMAMNGAGTAIEFQDAAAVLIKTADVSGTGSVEDDFNAIVDWTGIGDQTTSTFDVDTGEVWILAHNLVAYLWTGGVGSFGTGAGGVPATSGDFTPLGAATQFAVQSDYNLGDANVAVDPALGNVNYLTKSASGDGAALQTLAGGGGYLVAPTATFDIGAAAGDTGTTAINRNMTVGAVGNAVTTTFVGTLTGVDADTAGQELLLDEAVIDGGVF